MANLTQNHARQMAQLALRLAASFRRWQAAYYENVEPNLKGESPEVMGFYTRLMEEHDPALMAVHALASALAVIYPKSDCDLVDLAENDVEIGAAKAIETHECISLASHAASLVRLAVVDRACPFGKLRDAYGRDDRLYQAAMTMLHRSGALNDLQLRAARLLWEVPNKLDVEYLSPEALERATI